MRVFGRIVGSRSRSFLFAALAFTASASGCEEKKPVPPATVESAKPAPETIQKLPLGDLVTPADVVIFGSIEDVGKLVDPLSAMASSATSSPMQLRTQLPKIASETLGLSSADAIDFSKPVRLVVLDPKKHNRGFGVFMLHVKDEQTLIGTSPPNRATNDQGNAYGWDIQGGRMYVNFVGDVAVFTMEPETFGSNQAFLKQLAVATAPAGATLIARGANVISLYGADFEKALAGLKEQASQVSGPAAQGLANVVRFDEGMYGVLKELDTVTVSLRPSEDGLVMAYTAKPRAGTSLETSWKSLKPKADNAMLPRFPKSAAAYLAASVAPESVASLAASMKWILAMSLPPEQAEKFVGIWSELLAASTGDVVVGAYRAKDDLVLAGMSGLSDAEKAKAAQGKMLEMYADPAMKEALEKAGVKATVKAKAYKIGDVDVSVTKSELKNVPPGAAALAAMSPFLEAHSAITKDAAIIAYGPKAKETLTMLIDPKSAKDAPELGLERGPGLARAKKNGAPGAFLHAFIVPGLLAGGPPAGATDESGIVISAGAKDGVLEIDLDLPTSQIGPAVMALGALRSLGAPPKDLATPQAVPPKH